MKMEKSKSKALPKREDIDPIYKWKLEDIYDSIDKWEEDFNKIKLKQNELSAYIGKLGQSDENLLTCLKLCDELFLLCEKIFVYSRMKRDEDNGNSYYQELTDRASALNTEVYAAASFIVPEIISIPEEILRKFISMNKELKIYEFFINENLRQKKHILSQQEEEILALSSEVGNASSDIFTMFNNADIKFPYIKDENGEEIELTKGRYIKFLESRNRRVREDAFNSLYSTYGNHKNTLAAMLNSNVKKNRFYATVRKYDSALQASLDEDNISEDVYNKLIDTVNNNLGLLHRYASIRKRALKLDKLHMYDLYVPIVEEPEKHIYYEEAIELVKKGLVPLGEKYQEDLSAGFNSGWVDVFENQGKTSGAYSWGTYSSHPYVLLNYQGTINDVFTIAHEMGHALHSFYTNKTQPYINSGYKIFVAEVASTVNEALLMNHMLNTTTNKSEKAYLLNHHLEGFRGTLFRQVMFAEFEKLIHEKVENGEALTQEILCKTYYGLNQKYFGEDVEIDEAISMEWARIPHFYSSFYVYKYATGFSAAASLCQQILNEGQPAVDRYIGFLSSGGSDYPLELLKKSGVDLSTPKPIEDAMVVFKETLDEMEELIL